MENPSSSSSDSAFVKSANGADGKSETPTNTVESSREEARSEAGSSVSCSSKENEPNDGLGEIDAIMNEENERLATISLPGSDNQDDEDQVQEISQEDRYKKLVELLTKSQFYTDFLIKKLEADQKVRRPKKERKSSNGDKIENGFDTNTLRDSKDNKSLSNALSPVKSRKRNAKQMLTIAADVISNKKQKVECEEVDEEDVTDQHLSRTLDNGLVVPMNQPMLLTGACLRNYQMEGLEWLKVLFENGVNGILADEMGLGKTIQVIALIAHLVEKNVRGPFLIIGPLSTLPNWLIEFERFTPELPVILYHGNEQKRVAVRKKMREKKVVNGKKMYPIVVTSYEYPLRDVTFLKKFSWRYIIIDEGHRIKNHQSQLSRALRKYEAANRLLLTGTPLQNNLSELWALLNFLIPEIFDNLEVFESFFNVLDLESEDGDLKLIEEEKKQRILTTMHKILSPFMLRRVKSEVELNLPPKKELIVYAPMTPVQLDLYRAVLDYNFKKLCAKKSEEYSIIPEVDGKRAKRSCAETHKRYVFEDLQFDENGDVADFEVTDDSKKTLVVKDAENINYAIRVKMQNSVMMMRKIVNHPYLVQYPLVEGTEFCRIDEDLVKTCGKLQVLDAMLFKLKERGHKVLLFSNFTMLLDVLEDYLSLRNYVYTRLDGNTSIEDRQEYIKAFNSDPEQFIFLISTRAGGLGINLAAADTVILYDSDWNPQADLQAQDRCHRIGQTRPVVVYRFVTAGTVDERIVVRGTAKRKLEKLIIQKGHYNSMRKAQTTSIDLEDLMKLLKTRDHHRIIHPNGFVFSDQELDELLDRSDMMDGKTPITSENGEAVQARSFRDYYGYSATKSSVDDIPQNEVNDNVKIIDEDSNDTVPRDVESKKMKTRILSDTPSVKDEPQMETNSETIDVEKCKDISCDDETPLAFYKLGRDAKQSADEKLSSKRSLRQKKTEESEKPKESTLPAKKTSVGRRTTRRSIK